ncbi:alpha carbonic anhydrase 1, chloroplastic-like [Populus nigra]|uniref:alpha carbonic anhydrase 1, chloroplastic-like n=1 Tax=Populus nigra TaxID=3691 RepID=UPI002B277B9C|nr:alpha carbonic anhydrase 1, chloroplastic-like [Populus nigra]
MAPQPTYSFIAIALLLAVASASATDQTQASALEFSYAGSNNGPANWGSLNLKFSACTSGETQSPVNIIKKEAVKNKKLTPLTRDYKRANASLVNNGFNIGLSYEGNPGVLIVDHQNYTLKEMHWHSPSEHQIDGIQYAAELHLVHKKDSGSVAVVSILYELGDADPFINKIKDKLDALAKEVCASNEEARIPVGVLDNKLLRKNTRKYYRYVGSFTSPPCTENVIWNILGKARTISKEQLEALRAPLGDDYKQNSRPVQSLKGRTIELYNEFTN